MHITKETSRRWNEGALGFKMKAINDCGFRSSLYRITPKRIPTAEDAMVDTPMSSHLKPSVATLVL